MYSAYMVVMHSLATTATHSLSGTVTVAVPVTRPVRLLPCIPDANISSPFRRHRATPMHPNYPKRRRREAQVRPETGGLR
jgi:hypothetical protein